jgi:hypothetical protein
LPAAFPFRIDFAFVLALIAAVGGSAAIHLGFESPLLRGLRTRLLPKRHYPVPAIS